MGLPGVSEAPQHAKAAQDLCAAHQAIQAAITANKTELGGHAVEAEKLLNQALDQLKQAAQFANNKKAGK